MTNTWRFTWTKEQMDEFFSGGPVVATVPQEWPSIRISGPTETNVEAANPSVESNDKSE